MKIRKALALAAALCLLLQLFSACASREGGGELKLKHTGQMELQFASQFSVDEYEGGYRLISLADGSRFLVIPEGAALPKGLPKDVVPLYQPLKNIYLAATSAMSLFDSLDRLDAIRLSGTKEEGWYIENARKAMQEGQIVYAGKYSAPDYELITASGCPLAVESMMIGHASDIKKQLEELGIAVLVDQSSNEPHPLGRVEWIKMYGVLLGAEEKAEEIFSEQAAILDRIRALSPTGRTAAFFYVSSTGKIVARKSGDYVSKMIALAGGKYIFEDLGDSSVRTSTVTVEPEFFYAGAKDADVIIYNSSIGNEPASVAELVESCPLLKDFKAVREGKVFCTGKNMYQECTALGEMIEGLHAIFADDESTLSGQQYFYRLR